MLSVLRAAEGWLDQHQVDAPRRSAELLLGKVLGIDRLQLYLQHDRPLGDHERTAMRALIARRGKHEPVAYLLGEWSFRGHTVEVSPAVLIPRPDVSKNALAIAARNLSRHDLQSRVTLRHGSWWEACGGEEPFDLLVSNPPYVDPAQPDLLADDVRSFEPPLALFSQHGDPASCYRAIAAGVGRHLRSGASLVLETGLGASDACLAVLAGCADLMDAELRSDLAANPRFLLARRR